MSAKSIHFFTEDINFLLKNKILIRKWINQTIKDESHQLQELNFIFCSDDYLLSINQQFLKHDTFTDVITFDNGTEKGKIYGDIFISIERIKENSKIFNTTFQDELHRVMIHGTLHLLGYTDKGKEAKAIMTQKESFYLSKRVF